MFDQLTLDLGFIPCKTEKTPHPFYDFTDITISDDVLCYEDYDSTSYYRLGDVLERAELIAKATYIKTFGNNFDSYTFRFEMNDFARSYMLENLYDIFEMIDPIEQAS